MAGYRPSNEVLENLELEALENPQEHKYADLFRKEIQGERVLDLSALGELLTTPLFNEIKKLIKDSSISEIDLSKNQMKGPRAKEFDFSNLPSHIQTLIFSDNQFRLGEAAMIVRNLAPTVARINFQRNQFLPDEAHSYDPNDAYALGENTRESGIKVIDLSDNEISPKCLSEFFRGLGKTSLLQKVDISDNNLGGNIVEATTHLKDTNFPVLNSMRNKIPATAMRNLVKNLKRETLWKRLNFESNPEITAIALCQANIGTLKVEELKLADCFVGSDYEIDEKTLERIERENLIPDDIDGAALLMMHLRDKGSTIRRLDLTDNEIDWKTGKPNPGFLRRSIAYLGIRPLPPTKAQVFTHFLLSTNITKINLAQNEIDPDDLGLIKGMTLKNLARINSERKWQEEGVQLVSQRIEELIEQEVVEKWQKNGREWVERKLAQTTEVKALQIWQQQKEARLQQRLSQLSAEEMELEKKKLTEPYNDIVSSLAAIEKKRAEAFEKAPQELSAVLDVSALESLSKQLLKKIQAYKKEIPFKCESTLQENGKYLLGTIEEEQKYYQSKLEEVRQTTEEEYSLIGESANLPTSSTSSGREAQVGTSKPELIFTNRRRKRKGSNSSTATNESESQRKSTRLLGKSPVAYTEPLEEDFNAEASEGETATLRRASPKPW